MPLNIDISSTDSVSTLFDADFIKSLTEYLGISADTPSEDMPLSVNELLEEAISSCEQEQWRCILKKDVQILLPIDAFCEYDRLVLLPLGVGTVTLNYKNLSGVDTAFTDFTQYAGEPIRLWSDNWDDLVNNCKDTPYPVIASYRPGYATFDDVPKSTIRALKILVSYNFEYRGADVPIPKAYEHNRNLGWLNSERANRYIVDDWTKVSPR